MELISVQRRGELIESATSRDKAEFRDRYAVDDAVFRAWQTGGIEAVKEQVDGAAEQVARRIARGMRQRRVKVISEPLSEYQRFIRQVSDSLVDAGEDLRWLPRRLASVILVPGNDFFVLDGPEGTMIIFNVLDGDDGRAEQQLFTDSDTIDGCRGSFDALWQAAVPHHRYRPV